MADAFVVDVGQSIEYLVEYKPEAVLIHARLEGDIGRVLHNKLANSLLAVEVKSLVFDNIFMLELLDVNKIGFD
jgi:hypothetical protein